MRYYTYLLLADGTSVDELGAQIRELPSRYVGDQERGSGYRQFLYLQPLTDIHLRSHYKDEIEPTSDIAYVYIFSLIALFILAIASINFMNLATARSAQRAKEVGMRKVAGAYKSLLVRQFLGESVVMSAIALVMAIGVLYLTLPLFNQLAVKSLTLQDMISPVWLGGIVLFTIVIGVVSGSYPAFVLSGFQPVEAFKGEAGTSGGSIFLRKGLVIFQFAISVTLIIGALIVFDQLTFMKNKNLGFQKNQILIFNALNHTEMRENYRSFKQNLAQIPAIRNTTLASTLPGRSTFRNLFVINRAAAPDEEGQTMLCPSVDHDFVDTFGLEVLAGRGFSEDFVTDAQEAYIINERALRALGWTDPAEAIGEPLTRQFSDTRRVIGVVKDFHFHSLQHAIEPLVLRVSPDQFNYVAVRLNTQNVSESIDRLQSVWDAFSPGRPFEYFFLDEDYDRQYRSEERIGGIMGVFTALAIFVACLGLFGLTSFTTQQRIKEIGVRKVLGASVISIVVMLARNVTFLVVIAIAVAAPLAFYAMNQWLEAFAYRTDIGVGTFILAAAAALIIAWLTVGYQSVKAALANPVDALKYE